jgi:hypothetical protein
MLLVVERHTPCTSIMLVLVALKRMPMQCMSKLQVVKSSKVIHLHVHRQLLMVFFLLYIEKSFVNAECRGKVSPASAFLPVVLCLSPASVFRQQGSVRYRWSRNSLDTARY